MKINADRKLTLNRETLSAMEDRQLVKVQGAANSVRSGCVTTCALIVCMT